MTFLDVLIIFALLFLILLIWLIYIEGLSCEEAFSSIKNAGSAAWRYLNEQHRVYQLQQVRYPIRQNLTPYEEEVAKLRIFKYFKYRNDYLYEKDLLTIIFETHGIASEYKENLESVKLLLEALFRDFYIQRLGCQDFPYVHVQHIQENETIVLVSCNAYGNEAADLRKFGKW